MGHFSDTIDGDDEATEDIVKTLEGYSPEKYPACLVLTDWYPGIDALGTTMKKN